MNKSSGSRHAAAGATNNHNGAVVVFVTKIESNDVLLGRGAPIINHPGNVRFRQLVNSRKSEYIASNRHKLKDTIAKEIVQAVNGRFLRKVEDPKELEQAPKAITSTVWAVADDSCVLLKVKQALREQETTTSSIENVSKARNETSTIPVSTVLDTLSDHREHPLATEFLNQVSPVAGEVNSNSSLSLRLQRLAMLQQQEQRDAFAREIMQLQQENRYRQQQLLQGGGVSFSGVKRHLIPDCPNSGFLTLLQQRQQRAQLLNSLSSPYGSSLLGSLHQPMMAATSTIPLINDAGLNATDPLLQGMAASDDASQDLLGNIQKRQRKV